MIPHKCILGVNCPDPGACTYGRSSKQTSPQINYLVSKWKRPILEQKNLTPEEPVNFKRNGHLTKSGRWVKPRNIKSKTINLPSPRENYQVDRNPSKTESYSILDKQAKRLSYGAPIIFPSKVVVRNTEQPVQPFEKNSPKTSTLLRNKIPEVITNYSNNNILWKKPLKIDPKLETDITTQSSTLNGLNGAKGISPIKSAQDFDPNRPTPDWYAAPVHEENLSRNPLLIMKNVSKNDIAIHYKVMEELSQMIFV